MNPAERPEAAPEPAPSTAGTPETATTRTAPRTPMAHRVGRPRARRGSVDPFAPGELLLAGLRRAIPAGRRGWLTVASIAAVCLVALVGALSPAAASPGTSALSSPAAPAASASTSIADTWASSPGSGIDLIDLTWKGGLVLVLLFVTLRVMGRMQGAGRAARTGHLAVLESRTLASKASLHLVAVGERRLVVGLTPSGMVALAELGADELPEPETELAAAGTAPSASAGALPAGSSMSAPGYQTLGSAALAPVDAFADRLSALLGKARAR